MGNTAGGLLYDIGSQVEFNNNNYWLLNEGSKKGANDDNQKEMVSIFRMSKTAQPDRVIMAQRCVQKLRTLKHPNVVSFIETADVEDSIALITETVTPLEVWLQRTSQEVKTVEAKNNLVQEVIWGFRCVIRALEFIHVNGSMIHGNVGLHAIFVMPGGDWKLGSLELASNMSLNEDVDYFVRFQHILNKPYASPERATLKIGAAASNESILKAQNPPYYIDIYSLGQCMQTVFNTLDLDMPSNLSKYLSLMLNSEIKKRPSAVKLVQSAVFNSDYIKLLESINDLSLKSPKEAVEVIGQLEPKIVELSKAMCAYKILPNVCRTLQMAINDFPNRDARESCRLNVQVSVNLLASMASMNKLDETIFRKNCVPIIVQLWPMTDRSVRTVLLQSLKSLTEVIPSSVVNKTIFDNIVAGFSDSNAKLRESTLMSLIFIVDKLDDAILQDRLVRCVVNLQNDGEASIRTNATIFLGKIASKLKEPVRVRILCNAFSKAMKDNFLHCRLAGLKTSTACVKLLDLPQMTSKIIPTASVLLLDKSPEVRNQCFLLIEACLDILKQNHATMSKVVEKSDVPASAVRNSDRPTSSNETNDKDGGWSSWSMLQGITKSIESATISATGTVSPASSSSTKDVSGELKLSNNKTSTSSFESGRVMSKNNSLNPITDDRNQNRLQNQNNDDVSFSDASGHNNKIDNEWGDNSFSNVNNKWDDDDITFNDEDFDEPAPVTPPPTTKKAASGGMKLPSASKVSIDDQADPGMKATTKKSKVMVKKLDVSKDNWDDF